MSDRSMEPALLDGDRILAAPNRRPPRTDTIVIFPHPGREEFWLVKRVVAAPDGAVSGDPLDTAEMLVLSDNRDASRADSRSFGPVPVVGSYRALLIYRPARRIRMFPVR